MVNSKMDEKKNSPTQGKYKSWKKMIKIIIIGK